MLKGELYYHVAYAHLQEQEQRNRDFDLKAAGCLGIATTITGMGAILLNGFLNSSGREMSTLSIVFIALSALVYICTLGCGLLVMKLFLGTIARDVCSLQRDRLVHGVEVG